MKRHLVGALVLAAAWAAAATAQPSFDLEDRVHEAVESYSQALEIRDRDARIAAFGRAKQLFASAAAAGVDSAELYTNLGNAALLSENLGASVLAYRRALLRDPSYSRAQQNLDHVRSLLPSWVPRPDPPGLLDSFFFWHHTLPLATRALVASLCFACAALLVAASIRFRQASLRTAALLPGLAWIGLASSVAIETWGRDKEAAVVTANDVVARAADSALAPASLPQPLPAGTEVAVVDRRPPWLRVRLANGRDAWLPKSAVMMVVETAAPDAAGGDSSRNARRSES